MEKFNNTTLFTGYLKQLLHNFNLPKYRVYTAENAEYFEKHKKESPEILGTVTQYFDEDLGKTIYPDDIRYIPYIKDGTIQEYIDGEWKEIGLKGNNPNHIHYYTYGDKILNHTKTLKIKDNIYDSYTHEYLGDYLRFKRDFLNVNLMPLYNCFSNRLCNRLSIEINLTEDDKAVFDTDNVKYKIYMIPVKLFKEYTIALDCSSQVEICCGLYGAYQDTRKKFKNLPGLTYKKISCSNFSQPFLYSELLNFASLEGAENLLVELAQNEGDLKLFLKIPQTNNSSIVILEGDYTTWNNSISDADGHTKYNYTVLNFEKISNDALPFDLKSPLQLLRFNTGYHHPFADRLIEYLIGNVINEEDEIIKDVKRVQKAIENNNVSNDNGTLAVTLPNGKVRTDKVFTYRYTPTNPGLWEEQMRYALYDYMTIRKADDYLVFHDLLGYVDKDTEKYYQYYDEKNLTNVSINTVTLDEEDE